MSQYAYPVSDVTVTGFTGVSVNTAGNRYQNIDEGIVPDDADYIASTAGSNASGTFRLNSLAAPDVSTGHILRWRVKAGSGFVGLTTYKVYLYANLTEIAAYPASGPAASPPASWTAQSLTLTTGQAASIGDYTNLRIKFEVTADADATADVRFSWAELEIPNAGTITLNVDSASIVVAGQDVSLSPGTVNLTADSASITLAGQNATTTIGLQADSASITLGGQDPTVAASIALAANSASISLTAQNASLVLGTTSLAVDSATITIGAADATILGTAPDGSITLSVDSASIQIQGNDANVPEYLTHSNSEEPGGSDGGGTFVPYSRANVLPKTIKIGFQFSIDRTGSGTYYVPIDGYCNKSMAAGFVFPLRFFDHASPDGWREGVDPTTAKIPGFSTTGSFGDLSPSVGPPLYPFWEVIDPLSNNEFRLNENPQIHSSYLMVSKKGQGGEFHNGDDPMRLALYMGRDYYGWRIAASDDLYFGTPMYPFDAHDDTAIFTYNSGQASVRVTNVPHGAMPEASQLHASNYNCTRTIARFYKRKICRKVKTSGAKSTTRTVYPWDERPIYLDGSLGTVCKSWYDCQEEKSDCPDSTLCVNLMGKGATVGAPYVPLSGITVDVINMSNAVVATGTTDGSGNKCFTLSGDKYFIRLTCPSAAGSKIRYYCNEPYILPKCGGSLNVQINYCMCYSCITVTDFDSGVGIPGLVGDCQNDQDVVVCNPTTINCTGSSESRPTTDGSGNACAWIVNSTGSGFPCPALGANDINAIPDPDWPVSDPVSTCTAPFVIKNRWISGSGGKGVSIDWDSSLCGYDACCGSHSYAAKLYDRAKWTRLIRWGCATYPSCASTSRHPSIVPRTLYAKISAPDPIWKYKNGAPIVLHFAGVRTVLTGGTPYCVQIWDSGCMGPGGYYQCIEKTVTFHGGIIPYTSYDETARTNKDYNSSRVIFAVWVGQDQLIANATTRSVMIVQNYTEDRCSREDPFAVAAGIYPDLLWDRNVTRGVSNGEGWRDWQSVCGLSWGDLYTIPPEFPGVPRFPGPAGTKRYYPDFVDIGTIPPCWGSLDRVCGKYPSGFVTGCLGKSVNGCTTITGPNCSPNANIAPGCSSTWNVVSGPINYSGSISNCRCAAACLWTATYELYE